MDVDSAHPSAAAIATRYATAGADDWTDVLRRADANGVATVVLETLFAGEEGPIGADRTGELDCRALDASTPEYLSAALRRRRSRAEQFELDLEAVGGHFADRGIPYAVIKTNVDHAYHPWDLNVLVSPADLPAADELLTASGWERTSLRAHPLARTEPGKRLYEHPVRHPVHLHRAVSWNGLTYLRPETVLDSRCRIDGVAYPDPVVDAAIHCAHTVFEGFSLRLVEALEIVRLLGDAAESDQVRARRLAVDNGWPAGFDLALTTATSVVDAIEHDPASVSLPRRYPRRQLVGAWLQHARRTGGWYEPPLNALLGVVK
ncbi:nucleotidyltransferase family protein [Halovivax cerinus]|uniref:Nucleotidyltransferase family protein n=1 Tax=Halovivax cerinus TaxID=1487865 RepID=A0ABD5NNM4_9EURY|nr:nucleotidyltransferase family protein [Halovivax cerinus]